MLSRTELTGEGGLDESDVAISSSGAEAWLQNCSVVNILCECKHLGETWASHTMGTESIMKYMAIKSQ